MSVEETLCRLCALKLPSHYLKNLKQLSDENLDRVIWQFLHIKMENDHCLPTGACMDCCKIVAQFYNFFNEVQNAQEKLKKVVAAKSEQIDSEIEIKYNDTNTNFTTNITKNDEKNVLKKDEDLFSFADIKSEFCYETEDTAIDENFESYQELDHQQLNESNEQTVSGKQQKNIEKRKLDLKCYKCETNLRTVIALKDHFSVVHNAEVEYMCNECRALFKNIDEFQAHLFEHDSIQNRRGFKVYKCEICDKEFTGKTNFTAHQYTHSGVKRFECELCGKKFTLKQHMEVHKYTVCLKKSLSGDTEEADSINDNKAVSGKTRSRSKKQTKKRNNRDRISRAQIKWKCHKCNVFFHVFAQLEKHFDKVHDGVYEFVCVVCEANFDDLIEFETHLTEEHSIGKIISSKKYACNICNKMFNHKTNLGAHQLIHSGIKNFACEICDRRFTRKQQLEGHKLTHLKAYMTFDCDQCDKKYKTMHLLQVHLKTHLPIEEQLQYPCQVCNKRFISLDYVKRHKKKVHDEIEEYICEQCGKSFRTKYNLDAHVKTHTNETPYICDQCFKAFKSSLTLKRHKLIHTGIKAFACEYCGKRFRLKAILNTHKTTHTNELPFECEHCKKCFRTKENLKIHYRQHTGERPYSCLECNHHFTNDSNFIKHLKGRHGLKNFSIVNNHQYPFVN